MVKHSMRAAFAASVLVSVLLSVSAEAQPYGLTGYASGYRYLVTHTAAGAGNLTDFQVRLTINTAAEIAAGKMRSDCADIRVYVGDGCEPVTPVNFWIADGTCNTAKTNIWLGLPAIAAGATTPLAIFWGNPTATTQSNGTAVFPIFFDDFNGASLDTNKWNTYGPVSQTGGVMTTAGGAAGFWSKNIVLGAGETVFGVRTNAQAASGADIEYGAATLIAPSGGNIHWASRTWTGVTWMAYDRSFASIGRGPSLGGVCVSQDGVGNGKWTNDPGDFTWFETEFFYELIPGGGTTFGIYDKFGAKREVTLGNSGCRPAATERAYWQFDHGITAPNPISSVDYAYVRKYAKPDPIVVATGIVVQASSCVANGSGPCTPNTAGSICRSVNCSANGSVCVPGPTSCWVDADCNSGQFCAQSTYTCTAKLTSGTALPTDGLHNTCSVTGTNAACQTGKCNGVTQTCAGNNGAACTAGKDCVVNVCATDGFCGHPGNEGICTPTDATTCRAGRCRPNGTCLPVAGCLADAECGASTFCSDASNTCAATLSNGTAIPDGHGACGGAAGTLGSATAPCASGQCNATTNTCAGPNTSTTCTTAAECVTNTCGADGHCGWANGEGTCTGAASSCRSGTCSPHGGTCVPAGSGACWVDADCAGTDFCFRSSFSCGAKLATGTALPADTLHATCPASAINAACESGQCNVDTSTCAVANSLACTGAADCVSNVCAADNLCGHASGVGTCTSGTALRVCRSGTCGAANACIPPGGCTIDTDCPSTHFCQGSTLACVPVQGNGVAIPANHGVCGSASGPVGAPERSCASGTCNATTNTCAGTGPTVSCTAAAECVVDLCGANGKCGLANREGPCTGSNAATRCQSGACSAHGNICVPSTSGSCWVDADCASGQFCHRATLACAPLLASAAALPTDGLHASCPASKVNAACASGHCNPDTGTCAAENGGACTSAAGCTANICDTDGKCGYASGAGPCTTGTQVELCRSGFCASARCVPGAGCGSDVDCPAAQFCDRDTFACRAPRSNGSVIPPSHGTCTGAPGPFGAPARFCASGTCNPTTNTCSGPTTATTCTAAAECTVNLCGDNGRCGSSDGLGPCTPANASTACQSGVCSTTGGLCKPNREGGCAVDADCLTSEACDLTTLQCKPRGPLGSATNPHPADTVTARGGGGCSATGSAELSVVALLAAGVLLVRRRRGSALALLLVVGTTARAFEPYQGFTLNRYNPSRGGSEFSANESLLFEGHTKVNFSVVSDLAFDPLILSQRSGERISPIVDKQFIAHVTGSVNFFDRLRLGVSLPVPFFQSGAALSTTAISYPAPRTATVGDLRLNADGLILRGSALRVALGLDVFLPTGQTSDYVSETAIRFSPRLSAAGNFKRLSYAAAVAYAYRPTITPSEVGGVSFGPELLTSAAVGVRVTPRIFVGPELFTSTVIDANGDSPAGATTAEAMLSGRAQVTEQWKVGLGLARGLTQTVGSPVFRLLLSVEFAPAAPAVPAVAQTESAAGNQLAAVQPAH